MTDLDPTLKPITDLSQKAVSVARAIDRLPPGRYMVSIIKPNSKHERWEIAIDEISTVQKMTVPREGQL